MPARSTASETCCCGGRADAPGSPDHRGPPELPAGRGGGDGLLHVRLAQSLGRILRLPGRAGRGELRRDQLRGDAGGGGPARARRCDHHQRSLRVVGGMVPASISPRASEIFQEGLRVPPKKLFVRGAVNRDLLDVILANCRIPEQNWGDLQALVAGLTTGERRMHELIRRFGPDTVDKAMDDLIDYSARKVEALIRRMPAGRYEFSDYIEDDVVTDIPIRLKVALTIRDGEIHLDFTGSDIQVGSAMNVPTAGRVHPFMSIALVNYFVTQDRTIPLNAGVLRRVRMTLPEGSVVNPKFP